MNKLDIWRRLSDVERRLAVLEAELTKKANRRIKTAPPKKST